MSEPIYVEQSAAFDDDRVYRYLLRRSWGPGRHVLWIMLNPSTADESKLDPTLRRVLDFSQQWGFDGFEVCNLYALRSTDPKGLWLVADPVGPNNDAAIQAAAKRAGAVIVGWGSNAKPDRARAVAQLLANIGVQPHALKVGKDGAPSHPLYLPKTSPMKPWHAAGLR